MTEYLVLWLSVFVFSVIGMLTNIVFFRNARTNKRTSRHKGLDSVLFGASGK